MKKLQVTPEMIADWKAKHGAVREVTIEENTFYFSQPTRAVLGLSMTKGSKDSIDGAEVLVENCYLGGTLDKSEIIADPSLLVSLVPISNEMMGVKKAIIKNC